MQRTSDEILKNCKLKLGNEFGSAFHGLSNDWTWALLRLNEYRELFARKEDVRFLNALTGGSFLWDVQQNFWEDLLLRVCRLTDPRKSGRKRNITIQALPPFVKKKEPKIFLEVQTLVNKAVAKADFARDWRNRRISHSAWDRTIEPAKPLAKASVQQVQDALDAVHAVLNAINFRLLDAELANMVGGQPRATEFICRARQLADSAKFIDDLIDGEGRTELTNISVARNFLKKVGRKPTAENLGLIMDSREAARRFS